MNPEIPPIPAPTRPRARARRPRSFEWLERRTLLATAAQLSGALPIAADASGTIAPGETLFFRIAPAVDELLLAQAHADGTRVRLSLLDAQGNPLDRSDGLSPGDPDDLIAQHVDPGTYYLELTGTGGAGPFTLTARGAASSDPGSAIALDSFSARPVAVGDFNGDGRLDIAAAYDSFDEEAHGNIYGVAVLMGNGDGTFRPPVDDTVGPNINALAVGDLDGDGRPDIAAGYETVDPSTEAPNGGGVAILLGNGDGTFRELTLPQPVAGLVTSLAVGQFTPGGPLDIAAGFQVGDEGGVAILLGRGDGTFAGPSYVPVTGAVTSLALGDLNDDGRPDVVAGYQGSSDNGERAGVAVLLGVGGGAFLGPIATPLGVEAVNALAVGDVDGDGLADVIVGYQNYHPASQTIDGGLVLLFGNGNGTFRTPVVDPLAVGDVTSVALGDLDGDGRPDVAASYEDSDPSSGNYTGGVAVLLGDGGPLPSPAYYPTAVPLVSLATGDFNGDGRPDVAYVDPSTGNPSVLLNVGGGTLAPASSIVASPLDDPTPADFTGDGDDDLVAIDQSGELLWRRGIPGQPGSFEPPVVVNPATPSRAFAVVSNGGRELIASATAASDQLILYAFNGTGFVEVAEFPTGPLPSEVVAADLTGDGVQDLVVRNAGDGTASIYVGRPVGFTPLPALPIGLGASDVAAADLANSGRDDLIVTDRSSGVVRVFPNILPATVGPVPTGRVPAGPIFGAPSIYQAGSGPYGLAGGPAGLASRESTSGLAVGAFTLGGPEDLAVLNPGTETLAVLDGLGGGALANARVLPVVAPGSIVRAADLRGVGLTDLVVLDSSTVDVYLGDGLGGFAGTPKSYAVPAGSDGLTIADVNCDGKPDLLIGDRFGDVLELIGDGHGGFAPFQDADRAISLVPARLGDGREDFVYTDRGLDRVTIQHGKSAPTILADQEQGLLSPGAATVIYPTIGGVVVPYLVFVDSGGNEVWVERLDGQGTPDSLRRYFTGDDPVSLTVADLDGNGLPDLVVADEGSNDVAILLGEVVDGDLTFADGPRLKAGPGPVSTVVEALPGDPFPDLFISDSRSGQVRMLPGRGQGFFDDQDPILINVPASPGPIFVGPFSGPNAPLDIVTINPGSNSLTFIPDFLGGGEPREIPSGGLEPVAAIEFTFDGTDDLLVANEGDGVLALFLGGVDGPDLSDSTEDPEVPNPTTLSYDAVSGDVLQFYAGTAGVEAATLLQFNLASQGGESGGGSSSGGGSGGGGGGITPVLPPPPPEVQVARLETLGDSPLAIVATLVTSTSESTSSESPGFEATVAQGAAGALPNQPIAPEDEEPSPGEEADAEAQDADAAPALPAWGLPSALNRLLFRLDDAIPVEDRAPEGQDAGLAPPRPAREALSPLNRLLFRLDDAIERARQDARESTSGPSRPLGSAEPSVRSLDAVLARWSPAPDATPATALALASSVKGLGSDVPHRDRRRSRKVVVTGAPADSGKGSPRFPVGQDSSCRSGNEPAG